MTTGGRGARDLAPVSALPQWYFAVAHVAFASALGVLVVDPERAAGTFHQPKVIALVHLLTVGWLTGSILGAFYIVAPLALGLPMRVTVIDWVGFGCFAAGAAGMVSHFWIATYDGMAWSAILVVAAVGLVGGPAARRARGTAVAAPVWLHLGLALFNFMAAAGLGILIGFDKSRGTLGLSSMTATYAHAHLAAVGWVLLMVIGMAYRLIPMMLPAAIPAGRALYVSALAIEAGLAVLFTALLGGGGSLPAGAALIACGIVSFVLQVRGILKTRKPRPPALPRPDWSTWQTHVALMWLLVALGCGLALTLTEYGESHTNVAWVYGVAGLVGFLAQMVSGVQGRIVPWYAWYRAQEALGGQTPAIAANALPQPHMPGRRLPAGPSECPRWPPDSRAGMTSWCAAERFACSQASSLARCIYGTCCAGLEQSMLFFAPRPFLGRDSNDQDDRRRTRGCPGVCHHTACAAESGRIKRAPLYVR